MKIHEITECQTFFEVRASFSLSFTEIRDKILRALNLQANHTAPVIIFPGSDFLRGKIIVIFKEGLSFRKPEEILQQLELSFKQS